MTLDTASTPTSSRPRIAVAGATGRVGSTLLAGLAADPRELDLRALTRSPDAARLPPGVAAAGVDFDQPSTLREALHGAERLFIAHGTSPRQADNEIALIDAAVAAGVRHVVKLSTLGAPSRLHPMDWHLRIEAHLATKDIGYTVLRPSAFTDILARLAAPVVHDAWGGAASTGRVNFIDTRDVAEVARLALLDDAHLDSQRAYHLTGPRAWSMPEVAAELSRLLGRAVAYQHRQPEQHRAWLLAAGVDAMMADLLLGLDKVFRESALAETTSTVAELTGRAPRSPADWLADNLARFRK